jgi:hypothetical protein
MKKLNDFDECMHKIRYIERTSSDADLARVLNMPASTFSEQKKKGKVPTEAVLRYCLDKQICIDWLLLKKIA